MHILAAITNAERPAKEHNLYTSRMCIPSSSQNYHYLMLSLTHRSENVMSIANMNANIYFSNSCIYSGLIWYYPPDEFINHKNVVTLKNVLDKFDQRFAIRVFKRIVLTNSSKSSRKKNAIQILKDNDRKKRNIQTKPDGKSGTDNQR